MTEKTPERAGIVEGLQKSIVYKRDGTNVELTMTFGLLNNLMQAVGNYDNIALVGMDPYTNDIILRKMLTLRNKAGLPVDNIGNLLPNKEELKDLAEIDFSPEDAESLLFFAMTHMVDFSMGAMQRAGSLAGQAKTARDKILASTAGLIGSQASALSKPAA